MNTELVRAIADSAAALGGRAMLVGGCVRDELLGRDCADVDCEVYGLAPEQLKLLAASFGRVDVSGEKYGIYSLRDEGIDLAMPRIERRTGILHGDFNVQLDGALPFERAAARRDFTVNAILKDALTGEIVDPFDGCKDLQNGILRAVPGGQFEEDPLRVLRGAQFCARFHLLPEAETLEAMRRMDTTSLSGARVKMEMDKALMGAECPDVFFEVLRKANALVPFFEEVAALEGVPQNPRYHPEGDAFVHTMLVLREAAAVRGQAGSAFMLAALVHDLGKAVTTKQNARGDWQSIGHETAGVPLVRQFCMRLGVSKADELYAQEMCRLHMRVHTCYYGKARKSRTNLLFDACHAPRDLALLAVCDARGTGKPRVQADEEERFIMQRLSAYENIGPLPTGAMILQAGGKPGPLMKKAIQKARRRVLCGEPLEEAVRSAAKETNLSTEKFKTVDK